MAISTGEKNRVVLSNMNRTSKKNIFAFLIFLVLFLIASFRSFKVGTDTITYVKGFVNPHISVQDRNFGYNTFSDIVRTISSDPRFFLIVTAFIIQFFIYRSISKYSRYSIFAMIVYGLVFYCLSLNILRQFIIIGVFYCFGIDFILEKKLIKYTILVLILCTFHELSLTLLPLYFFARKALPKLSYFLIWLVSFAALLSNGVSGISSFFNGLDVALRFIMANLPNYFSEIDNLTNTAVSLNGVFLDQLVFLGVFWIYIIKGKKEKTPINTIFFNIYFSGVVFQNVFFFLDVIARIAISFLFAGVLLVSNVFTDVRIRVLYVILLIILFYFRFVLNGVAGVF